MKAMAQSLRWRVAQFLELRWWRRYVRKQTPVDYLIAKEAYWQRLLRQLDWEIVGGARVLDAGCGPAGVFITLHDQQQVTALDPLLDRYETLPIFSRARYPNVQFVTQPLESVSQLPPFDVIYCFNAINHVRDWNKSLDVLTSLARAGTRMILTSDVHRHRWLVPIFRVLPGDALHPQQHRTEDYRQAVQQRGWRIEREEVLRTEPIFAYRAWVCIFSPAG